MMVSLNMIRRVRKLLPILVGMLFFLPINLSLLFPYFFENSIFLNILRFFSILFVFLLALIVCLSVRKPYFNLVLTLASLYFLAECFLSFLEWGRNLNTRGYDALVAFSQTFFGNSALDLLLLFLIGYAILLLVVPFGAGILPRYYGGNFLPILLSQYFATLLLTDYRTIVLILERLEITKIVNETPIGQTVAILGYLFCNWIVVSYFSYRFIISLKHIRENKASHSLAITTSLILAIVFNFCIQSTMAQKIELLGYTIFPGAESFQILVFFLVFSAVYFITNRYLLSTLVLSAFVLIGTIANSLKFQMREEPILPSDLAWILNPKELFAFVSPFYILSFVGLVSALGGLYWFFGRRFYKGPIIRSLVRRLSYVGLSLTILSSFFFLFLSSTNGKIVSGVPVLSVLYNLDELKFLGNTVNSQMKSLSFVWYKQLTTAPIEKPEHYSQSKMQEIQEKYQKRAAKINENRSENISDQTLIYILSESFSDPRRVKGVEVSQDPIPNIKEISSHTTSGLMLSDGYGGGTANMEFQSLMGLPYYNLSSTISTIYTEVVPKMAYLPSISNQFQPKNRLVIHMADEYNYSRNVVYSRMDFARFISNKDREEFGVVNQGLYASDHSVYDIAVKEINKDESQFISLITMQNHVPWSEENPPELLARHAEFSEEENRELTSYVRLLHFTDQATKEFLEQLSQFDKKITVVFYGDHLPGLYPLSLFEEDPRAQYETDYFIWSNFETPKLDYPLLNSSDFTAAMLEQTDSKVSPYYALLTEVLKKASVNQVELSPEAQEIADDLKLVQYDLISGKGYLKEDFFAIEE